MTIATRQLLQLTINTDLNDWVGVFDRLEVWRSRLGSSGPYQQLTSNTWTSPSFSFQAQPYVVNGKVLSLLLDEKTPIVITFSGSDPISAASVASQIQAQSGGLLQASVSSGLIKVSVISAGASHVLRIQQSDAAGIFTLPQTEPDCLFFGADPWAVLIPGQQTYTFTDYDGSAAWFYETRYINSLSNAVSNFSASFSVVPASLPASYLIVGTIDLVDLKGNPLANTRILLFNRFNGTLVNGKAVASTSLEALTDNTGHAEFTLVRGSIVTVSIAGSTLTRDITVPTDLRISSFTLLDPHIAAQDVFNVQVPPVVAALKNSL